MATNLPTFFLDPDLTRAAEVTAADWAGGLNKGASCAPGIGINTGNPNPKLSDWTLLDQAGAARVPQQSQHIGTTVDDINAYQGADINDTLAFVEAVGAVAPDAVIASGAVNKTGQTLQAGDRAWGVIPVA